MSDPTLYDLQLHYSGASGTPATSIGGAIHANRLLSQSATGLTTLTGITIVDGLGNGVGAGTLTFTAATKLITWTPFGGSQGTAVDISVDGGYFVQGYNNGGGLCITVVAASLPTSNVSNTITLANVTQQMFLDQTKAESNAGVTKYHCFYIKNAHATLPMVAVKAYIAENTNGADTCTIWLDPLVAGTGAVGNTPVANENTAPSGSTFVAPDSITHADVLAIGTLTAGQCRAIWVKQLTPAGIDVATLANTFKLGLYIKA